MAHKYEAQDDYLKQLNAKFMHAQMTGKLTDSRYETIEIFNPHIGKPELMTKGQATLCKLLDPEGTYEHIADKNTITDGVMSYNIKEITGDPVITFSGLKIKTMHSKDYFDSLKDQINQ